MASSSSFVSDSQYCSQWKYDVFLSFRGADTRRTFTGHLYEALKNRGIFTFQDDKRLEGGDSISEKLLKAIEESQVAIIIFSRNYATSRWCLNELVKIMECKEEENRQIVIPIFYDVDPSHVRYQSESFAEAFSKHESRYKDDVEGMQKVQAWRTALTAVANLKGYDIREGIESEKIQQIVDHISSNFCKSARSLSFLQDVVGINAHLEKLKSLLQIEINDVRVLGIWGIGGVGKTTIAKALFDTLSYQFKSACFLADVKENARNNQLHSLQNTLLSKLLRKKDAYVDNKLDGKSMIPSRLSSMKVLIVLDDIDHGDHLEYLAGDVGWFGKGSRVIVTTRNRHLIEKDDAIYEVPTLPDHEAMQLFNLHAFKRVPDERFKELSLEVVDHAKGLPLALKVWGSLLHKKGLIQWRRTVDHIKKNSNSEIVEKLKISYDGLEPEEQKIFLDIVCFFRGDERTKAMQILESCGFEAVYGLDVLIDKSLVFISEDDLIEMHDLIEDMGKYVVNMQKDLGKPSRIWKVKDFEDVMVGNTGTIAVEAIWIHNYMQKLRFNKEAMKNMQKLRILCIQFIKLEENDPIEYLSNNLRWFLCHKYPWKLLPQNFNPTRLVHLELRWSSLYHLWNETKELKSLRRLDLYGSESLKSTPDFGKMPNLEYLDLSGCTSLEEVHHSLRCSKKLIELNLSWCKSLERFPYVNVESLESLDLKYCSSLEKFPEFDGRVKRELEISMSYSGIKELPSSIIHLLVANLTKLYLSGMKSLVALPSSICKLKALVKLDVSECLKLESFPEEIGDLETLEELDARFTLISRPPSSIIRLIKLKVLNFAKYVSEDRSVHFVFPQVNEGLLSLEQLDLSYCNLIDGGLPEDIGSLSSLKELNLSGNNFEYLPRSIAQLGALQSLHLSYCKRLKRFPYINVESLEYLDLKYCSSLEKFPEFNGRLKPELEISMSYSGIKELPSSIIHLLVANLTKLDLSSMKSLVSLPSSICELKGLVNLDVSKCLKLESLPEEIGDLETLEVLDARFTLISRPPSSIIRLIKLKVLDFAKSVSEDRSVHFVFPQVNEGLLSLEQLDLSYCNLIDGGLPEDIGSLSSLKELNLSGNNFEYLPQSIAQLGALQSLHLSDCIRLKRFPYVNVESLEYLDLDFCSSLEKLPEFIGIMKPELQIRISYSGIRELPSSIIHLLVANLTKLDLSSMKSLVSLPSSICKLKGLVTLDVSECLKLESLPQEIGDLENLENLDARYTLISRPPSSIVRLNKLKLLTFEKYKSEYRSVHFVFPKVNEGLLSLEQLDLSCYNIIDGGIPEDIGCLSSLKKLYLRGNNFEHLPRSIAKLGALRYLDLSECKRLTQLPKFPQQLDTIDADWSNDWICNSLFHNISSFQHDISDSGSLSLRVFMSRLWFYEIPSWFQHRGIGASVSVNLPENWYVSDNFLGFAVCYTGKLIDEITAHLIPLCDDDGMSSMTQKFALSNHSGYMLRFLLVPLAGLWDASKANGKTSNDYGHFRLFSTGQMKRFGVRLLYKDEAELHIGIRRSRYEEGSCSSSKKQRPLLQLFPTSPGL